MKHAETENDAFGNTVQKCAGGDRDTAAGSLILAGLLHAFATSFSMFRSATREDPVQSAEHRSATEQTEDRPLQINRGTGASDEIHRDDGQKDTGRKSHRSRNCRVAERSDVTAYCSDQETRG